MSHEEPKNTTEESQPASADVNLNSSQNKQVNINQAANIENNFYGQDYKGPKPNNKIPIIKESEVFVRVIDKLNGFEEKLELLKESNILLLGDTAHGKSPHIAYCLASEIENSGNKDNIRSFSLNSRPDEELTIHSFSFNREEVNDNVIIIINATKNEGKFVGSLLDCDILLEEGLSQKLKENKIFLILLIPALHITEWLKSKDDSQKGFPYWVITENKPKEETIEIQKEFESVLERLYDFPDEERIVIQTILFVCSFFPNLSFSDFKFLVDLWLFTEEPEFTTTRQQETEKPEIIKLSPKHLWDKKTDYYFRKCCLFQNKQADERKFVAINKGYNELQLQILLEQNIPMTIQQKLESIIKLGLVFHKSEEIAATSISLFAQYFLDGEQLNDNWFLYAFRLLEANEILDETLDILDVLGEIPQQYIRDKEKGLQEKQFYYRRIAQIFRQMLRYEQLNPIVKRILNQLIHERYYRAVFILIKQLQYSNDFDEYYWLKQLMERGDSVLQDNIEDYILSNLINNGISIESIRDWFPAQELEFERRSKTNEKSLSILITYVITITQHFDQNSYHQKPSSFPLFIFESRQKAENVMEFLIENLLYPWRDKIWGKVWEKITNTNKDLSTLLLPYISLFAQTLERWCFILYLQNKDKSEKNTEEKSQQLTNKILTDIVLEKVVLYTTKQEQQEVVACWQSIKNNLGKNLRNEKNVDFRERESALRHKNFISKLEENFRKKIFQQSKLR